MTKAPRQRRRRRDQRKGSRMVRPASAKGLYSLGLYRVSSRGFIGVNGHKGVAPLFGVQLSPVGLGPQSPETLAGTCA